MSDKIPSNSELSNSPVDFLVEPDSESLRIGASEGLYGSEMGSTYCDVSFDVPDHLQAVLDESSPGTFRLPVIIYSARLYSFVPEGKVDRIEGCSIVFSDNVYEQSENFIGFRFQKVSLPCQYFSRLSKLPKKAVFVYQISRSLNQKNRLYQVFT